MAVMAWRRNDSININEKKGVAASGGEATRTAATSTYSVAAYQRRGSSGKINGGMVATISEAEIRPMAKNIVAKMP